MSPLVKNIFRFIILVLLQAFVLDKIYLHQMALPYIYFLFVLWLPFKMGRIWQILLAFLLGFALDSFRHSPGFHSAACVLIAYIRPFLINLLIPQEGAETNYAEPSIKSMGGIPQYLTYIIILTIIHHSWLYFLEAMEFGNIWYFLAKTFLSTAISVLLIMIAELLMHNKQKFITNTA